MKKNKVIDPILALAFATLTARKNEPIRFAAAIKKAANCQGFRRPKRKEFIAGVATDLGKLTHQLQRILATELRDNGAELVQNGLFRDRLLALQTGYILELVSTCSWADYLLGRRNVTAGDPRCGRFHNLQCTLKRLLCRRQNYYGAQATVAGSRGTPAAKTAAAAA